MPDAFDRLLGAYDGLPNVIRTKAATVRTMPLLGVGGAQLYIVQTVRQKSERDDDGKTVSPARDTIFLEYVSGERAIRLVLPAEVADTIARQRDALTAKTRTSGARKAAATRKARGIRPAFLKARK
jgi:hypothetical protein